MAEGYFIGRGDKTTCGGIVLDGDVRVNIFGLDHAREGGAVTCGNDQKTYEIIGGVSHIESHGKLVAGTLDSFSSCPCKARLIPSVYAATYSNDDYPSQASRRAAEPAASRLARDAQHRSSFTPNTPVPAVSNRLETHEPGFYVVPQSTTREALETTLFPMRNPAVMRKFYALNSGLSEIKAGSMIVLSDPNNFQCTREESQLMQAAAQTNEALSPLTPEEADFMQLHRDEIRNFLSLGSTAIGVGEVMFANNLNDLKNILQEIEALHQRAFLRDGHLRSPEFFSERRRLLAQLDTRLTSLMRKSIGLPDHPNLKSALGISSRSLVHQWTQAGAPGQIPGYATHIEGIAKAAKVIKYGGWLGTALGAGASYMKVQNVCAAGNSETCEKVKFTEVGSFTGTMAGGALFGAALSSAVVGGLCVALGVPTLGTATLACGLIVVGAGSAVGGTLGGSVGEWAGEKIYEGTK